ncbi:transcriptional regulator, partial [Vibrio cholerae]
MERKFFLGNQVVFDTLKGEISSDLKSVGLGSRDAAILKLLCEQRNKVVQKED